MNIKSTTLRLALLLILVLCISMLTACTPIFQNPVNTPEENSGEKVSSGEVIPSEENISGNEEDDVITPADTDHLYTEIRVSSAKDLFQNIRPFVKIILTEEYYNTSDIDISSFNSRYVNVEEEFKGYEFVIKNVSDFEISSDPNVMAEIVTTCPLANVISLVNCNNVKINGIVAGHEVEKGSCIGGVVYLEDCSDIEINDCHLYGCGTYGITSYNSKNVKVNNTEIYECSYGLIDISDSKNFEFNNCTFRDSMEYTMFAINGCDKVNFNNCTISDNYSSDYSSFIYCADSKDVIFSKCVFKYNMYSNFIDDPENACSMVGCKISDLYSEYEYYDDYYPDDEYYPEYDYDVEPDGVG